MAENQPVQHRKGDDIAERFIAERFLSFAARVLKMTTQDCEEVLGWARLADTCCVSSFAVGQLVALSTKKHGVPRAEQISCTR